MTGDKLIKLVPNWVAVLPILLNGLQNGDSNAQRIARQELERMAAAADAFNADETRPTDEPLDG